MNKTNKLFYLGILLFISIIFSYIFLEDTLGGARHDYLFHEKFIILFAEDFKNTFNNYGHNDLYARNSPIFYIFVSLIYKAGVDLDTIRYLNIISILLLIYIFYNCLKIKFKNITNTSLMLMSFVIFLSPTVRSLAVWPYPILYGFILFLFSIKFYLKFNQVKKDKINQAFKSTLFLAFASYITPNFCVFAIFFLYKFYLEFKNSKYFLYILVLNFLLAAPAITYYFVNDFYLIKYSVSIVDLSVKLNPFNKIVIILSLISFYFIPFLNKKSVNSTKEAFKNAQKEKFLIVFLLTNLFLFNFPSGNFGGGIFYHFSQYIFGNNFFLFIIFFLSIFLFKASKLIDLDNILLFFCLILYNLQVSIYHKYFDPLLLFIFLFLMSKNEIRNQKNFIKITKNYYILYSVFLGISFYKVIFL
tara:strand:+ start:1730 stop:2977 length:1248 start_codon:yes stop_codon:yes gene_type:complete